MGFIFCFWERERRLGRDFARTAFRDNRIRGLERLRRRRPLPDESSNDTIVSNGSDELELELEL
jgi:hypothetical protein